MAVVSDDRWLMPFVLWFKSHEPCFRYPVRAGIHMDYRYTEINSAAIPLGAITPCDVYSWVDHLLLPPFA